MRTLTIHRRKTFVGCAMKLKVYIEDAFEQDTVIRDTPCRKLGELKNGETASFPIDNAAAKVFVIADQLSKNYCNEFYALPEGEEDITLTGKPHFNPATGNAFRFDGNNSAEAVKNRRHGTRKGLLILLAAILIGGLCGYLGTTALLGNRSERAQVFSKEGMSITLTNAFRETEVASYTTAFDSAHVAVFLIKEPFTLGEGIEAYTLEQYGQLVMQANGKESLSLQQDGSLMYFEYDYTDPENGEQAHYITYLYKANDAFWIIQFATRSADWATYAPRIADWARSVTFTP